MPFELLIHDEARYSVDVCPRPNDLVSGITIPISRNLLGLGSDKRLHVDVDSTVIDLQENPGFTAQERSGISELGTL
jgi:hypothetical protein